MSQTIKYQQGDVILKKISKKQFEKTLGNTPEKRKLRREDGKTVLAFGEATGHHHRFESPNVVGYSNRAVTVSPAFSSESGRERTANMIEVLQKSTLFHEEHKPIDIPSGYYQIVIVREYDPFLNRFTNVVD